MNKKFELKHKRTLNSKVFYNGDGTYTLRAHVSHIHYKDKHTKEFEDIDLTLIPTGNGWEMRKSNYEAEIPKYADGEFKFIHSCLIDVNTEQGVEIPEESVSFIPLNVHHVVGQVDDSKRRIVYPNAFGEGINLEIEVSRTSFRKYVVIKQQPKKLTKDLEFSFAISIPVNGKVKWRDGLTNEFKEWKGENLEILGNTLFILGVNRETWLRPLRVWDSAGNETYVKVKLRMVDGTPVLTKILPKDFLLKATYPVYTDTTASYYSGNGDGWVRYYGCSNWDTCHDATEGTQNNYTDTRIYVKAEQLSEGGNYDLIRAFLPFDTSGLPDDADIAAATLHFHIYQILTNDGTNYLALVQTTQSSTSELTNGDFDQCGAVNNPTEGASRLEVTSTGWHEWELNSTGLGWISKTGWTKLGIRSGNLDCDDVVPTYGSQGLNLNFYSSESDYDPYLEVTYQFLGAVTLEISQSQTQNRAQLFSDSVSLAHSLSQTQDRMMIASAGLQLSHSLSQSGVSSAQAQSQTNLSHFLGQEQNGGLLVSQSLSLAHALSQTQTGAKAVPVSLQLSHYLSQSQSALSAVLMGYMASALSQKTPDYDAFLPNLPIASFSESISITTNILEVDSGDEERVQIAQPDFRVTLNLPKLKKSQLEELIEFYTNETKANGKMRSFKWTHPVDGHTYVVRFDTDLIDVIRHGLFTDELSITLRVLGYSSLGWS